MKFVVRWAAVPGRSARKRQRELRRSLEILVRWLPPEDQTFHQFVVRVDGGGGFAVIETDSAAGLLDGVAKFSPWFEFDVFPVLDIADAVSVLDTAVNWLDFMSVSNHAKQQKRKRQKKTDKKKAKKDKQRAKKIKKRK